MPYAYIYLAVGCCGAGIGGAPSAETPGRENPPGLVFLYILLVKLAATLRRSTAAGSKRRGSVQPRL